MGMIRIFKTAAALALAAVLLGAPFWWNALQGLKQKAPVPEKPAVEKECVLPAADMRANHMRRRRPEGRPQRRDRRRQAI